MNLHLCAFSSSLYLCFKTKKKGVKLLWCLNMNKILIALVIALFFVSSVLSSCTNFDPPRVDSACPDSTPYCYDTSTTGTPNPSCVACIDTCDCELDEYCSLNPYGVCAFHMYTFSICCVLCIIVVFLVIHLFFCV